MVSSSLYFLAFLAPILAVFAIGQEAFLISILMSTILLFTFCKQKPVFKQAQMPKIEEKQQENTSADDEFVQLPTVEAETDTKREEKQDQILTASYSESDHFSTTSSEDDDREWPYQQRLDCSDDSISDEESLIEIAIPTGQFVSAGKDFKCCKYQKDFWADLNDNEEDNLIEIDIYMGSIKCSTFEI